MPADVQLPLREGGTVTLNIALLLLVDDATLVALRHEVSVALEVMQALNKGEVDERNVVVREDDVETLRVCVQQGERERALLREGDCVSASEPVPRDGREASVLRLEAVAVSEPLPVKEGAALCKPLTDAELQALLEGLRLCRLEADPACDAKGAAV